MRRSVLCAMLFFSALVVLPAQAQVQRSFVNLGFESPNWGSTRCYVQVPSSMIPGWETTHPSGISFGTCTNTPFPAVSGPSIEIWGNGGPLLEPLVTPAEGTQFAELNAQQNSRIYQNVCMATGEQVAWSFLHRGRTSATVNDVAEFNINSSANTVVTARTQNDGGTGYTATDCIASEGGVTSGTCNAPAQVGTWRRYSGTFTWSGASGAHNVGFQAISAAGGITTGNFIDDINLTLRPYVEFSASSFTLPEQGGTTGLAQLRVIGVVPAGGITILVNATGGTATPGIDYTVGNVMVPAGNYGAGQLLTVPVTVINDTIIENNESIQLTLQPSPANYTIASTTSCGTAPIASSTVIITDNDVDLRTTKIASTAAPAAGTQFTYTLTFQNNTARPTVGPMTAHDVTAVIADAVPAGITFQNWACTASGGAICPTASGNGAIAGNASLPAGINAAGGTLTFTITASANGVPDCGVITNTSTIATPAGFQEGTLGQVGFTTPAPGGIANNTASVNVDPFCRPTLTLRKTTTGEVGGPFNFTLTNTVQNSGTATTASAGTPVQVDGDTAIAGLQPFVVAAINTAITISESALPTGWALGDAICTSAGGAVGSRSGNSYTIPAAGVVEGAAIVCSFINRRFAANLSITKSNTPASGPSDLPNDALLSGRQTAYTIVVRNSGPDAADNALVRDQPANGLSACSVTCANAGLSGGAACPAVPSGILSVGGAPIPVFPANSSVTLVVACTVD